MNRKNESAKDTARRLVESMPDSASWDDLVYQFARRRSDERRLGDIRLVSEVNDIRRDRETE